jgi:tyrosyl-DNA phosphodiesterase-1
MFPTE